MQHEQTAVDLKQSPQHTDNQKETHRTSPKKENILEAVRRTLGRDS